MDKIPPSTLHDICRICFQKEKCTSLFTGEHSKSITDTIFLCFQILLHSEDHLPTGICNECSHELNMANKFRLKCTAFEEKFRYYCDSLIQDFNSEEYHNHSENEKSENEDLNHSLDPFKCDQIFMRDLNSECGRIKESNETLAEHGLTKKIIKLNGKHTGKVTGYGVNRLYECTECDYATRHNRTIVNHMRRHTGERPYHCLCGKSFAQRSTLVAHEKTHNDTKHFTCTLCGIQFKLAFALKAHMRVHEPGQFSCSLCCKIMKSAKALKDHMHRHENIRNYSCEECGDTFVTSSDLHGHKAKHSADRLVECQICGFKTKLKKNLAVHLRRHTGQGSLKCPQCPVRVYTQSDLRRHGHIHTREKLYQCPECAQKFSFTNSLNRHMKNTHHIVYRWNDAHGNTLKAPSFFQSPKTISEQLKPLFQIPPPTGK